MSSRRELLEGGVRHERLDAHAKQGDSPMSNETEPTVSPSAVERPAPALGRRHLLRGGALFGAAAGAMAAGLRPGLAHAADGDSLVLGTANSASSPTTLTVGGDAGGVDPALALENAD